MIHSPARIEMYLAAIRRNLTDDLREGKYRHNPDLLAGHSYVATEALYHLLGGTKSGLKPMFVRHENEPHWFLRSMETGADLDPAAGQFMHPVPYERAVGKGLLTAEPSERARTLMDRVAGSLKKEALAKAIEEGGEEVRVASIAVFNKEGQLLIGRRAKEQKWNLPGGHIEDEESPEEAARRELKEETGLSAGKIVYRGEGLAGKKHNIRVYSFVTRADGEASGTDDPDGECDRFEWVDPKDIPVEIAENLYNDPDITLRLLGYTQTDGEIENPLAKGSWQRRHPFNPRNYWGHQELRFWQMGGGTHVPPRLTDEGRIRALHRLHGDTSVRWGSNGKREFLLHRGFQPKDQIEIDDKKNVSFARVLGFTPDLRIANQFGGGKRVLSLWVPEDAIRLVARQAGTTDPMGRPGPNDFYDEREVLVDPHVGKLAAPDEISRLDPITGEILGKSVLIKEERGDVQYDDLSGDAKWNQYYRKNIVPLSRIKTVRSGNWTPDQLMEALDDPDFKVRLTVLHRVDVTPQMQVYALEQQLDRTSEWNNTLDGQESIGSLYDVIARNPILPLKMHKQMAAKAPSYFVPSLVGREGVSSTEVLAGLKSLGSKFSVAWLQGVGSYMQDRKVLDPIVARYILGGYSSSDIAGFTPTISRKLYGSLDADGVRWAQSEAPLEVRQGFWQLGGMNSESAVLQHPNSHVTDHDIERAVQDSDFRVVEGAIKYIRTPEQMDAALRWARRAPMISNAKNAILHHRFLSKERIDQMLKDPQWQNDWQMLLGNPNITEEQVGYLGRSPDPATRYLAAIHPLATSQQRVEFLSDPANADPPLGDMPVTGGNRLRFMKTHPELLDKDALSAVLKTDDHDLWKSALKNKNSDESHVRRVFEKVKADPFNLAMLSRVLIQHPAAPDDILAGLAFNVMKDFDDGQHDLIVNILEHPNVSRETVEQIAQKGPVRDSPSLHQKVVEVLNRWDPDAFHTMSTVVKFGTGKLRKVRDMILATGKDGLSPKALPPGDYAKFRLPNGDVSATKIQQHIDALPGLRFNVAYGHPYGQEKREALTSRLDELKDDFGSKRSKAYKEARQRVFGEYWNEATNEQMHSLDPSRVVQINLTTDQVQKMHSAGVWNTFRKMAQATAYSNHPAHPTVGLGWVRLTHDGDQVDWFMHPDHQKDEAMRIQRYSHSNAPVEFHRGGAWPADIFIDEIQSDFGQSFVKQAAAQAAQAGIDPALAATKAEEKWPTAHYDKIREIVFGGHHPNEVLHEAFQQHLRDLGLHGARMAIHQGRTKGLFNQWNTDRPLPGHAIKTYDEVPRKIGMESARYGEGATEKHPDAQGMPTWAGEVRKSENPMVSSDVQKSDESEGWPPPHKVEGWLPPGEDDETTISDSSEGPQIRPASHLKTQRFYHGTPYPFLRFKFRPSVNTVGVFGLSVAPQTVQRHAFFFSESPKFARGFTEGRGHVVPVRLHLGNVLDINHGIWTSIGGRLLDRGVRPEELRYIQQPWEHLDGDLGRRVVLALKDAGYDSVTFFEDDPVTQEKVRTYAVFHPAQIARLPRRIEQTGWLLGALAKGEGAFHAGDAGIAEHLGRMTYGRGTGHFGTGTYFVSDATRLNTLQNVYHRPVLDIKDHLEGRTLFRPQSANWAMNLHDCLKDVNNAAQAYRPPGLAGEALQELDLPDDYHDRFRRHVGHIVLRLQYLTGLPHASEAMVEAAIQSAAEDDRMRNWDSDSASTRLMRHLGYDGVDVRHLPDLDNTMYGSVVYRPVPKGSLQKALADVPQGKLIQWKRSVLGVARDCPDTVRMLSGAPRWQQSKFDPVPKWWFDYSHLLSPDLRKQGYGIRVRFTGDEFQSLPVYKERVIGGLFGNFRVSERDMWIDLSQLAPPHQGKGVGKAMYEAALAHAYNAHGIRSVLGGGHSSDAYHVHQALSAKHGLDYRADPDVEAGHGFGDYEYTLKSEEIEDELLAKSIGYVTFPRLGLPQIPSEPLTSRNPSLLATQHLLTSLGDVEFATRDQYPGFKGSSYDKGWPSAQQAALTTKYVKQLSSGSGGGQWATVAYPHRFQTAQQTGFAIPGSLFSHLAVKNHEAQHSIFGAIEQKYALEGQKTGDPHRGVRARGEAARALVGALPPELRAATDAIYELTHGGGSLAFWGRPNEERVCNHHTYLMAPAMRDWIHSTLKLTDPDKQRAFQDQIKQSWQIIKQRAATLTEADLQLDRNQVNKAEDLQKMALVHDDPVHPKMVYRVENKEGIGPYRSGAFKRGLPVRSARPLIRTPYDDFEFADRKAFYAAGRRYLFGFEAPEHAALWFGGSEALKELEQHGFSLVARRASKVYRSKSGEQVFFDPIDKAEFASDWRQGLTPHGEYWLHYFLDQHGLPGVAAYTVTGKQIGQADFVFHYDWTKDSENPTALKGWEVDVQPDHQHKGIATAMYQLAEQKSGLSIVPGEIQTPAGKAFWASRGSDLQKAEIRTVSEDEFWRLRAESTVSGNGECRV